MSDLSRESFDNHIEILLTKAENLIPNEELPELPYMDVASEVHEWYQFEYQLWNVGEKIRLLTAEHKKELNELQVKRIIEICLDQKAKRGRQSFILLLGKKCYCTFADEIIDLIDDDDVGGHVIATIRKMQVGQYVDKVKPFLDHKQTWIRNEAKKYIQKFESYRHT